MPERLAPRSEGRSQSEAWHQRDISSGQQAASISLPDGIRFKVQYPQNQRRGADADCGKASGRETAEAAGLMRAEAILVKYTRRQKKK